MKHLLIIFSLLLTSVSWSKDVDIDKLYKREGLYYEKFSEKPFTGNATGWKRGQIIKGKADGKWVEYDDDGKIIARMTYKNGLKNGEFIGYDRNGTLAYKYNYKNDLQHGTQTGYRIESNEILVKEERKNGVQHGIEEYYYANGNLFYKHNYVKGKREGKQLSYDENGELVKTEIYKDGQFISETNH